MDICQKIASELNIKTQQVEAAIKLLDEGATVPFIARYRKEATNNLDDTQLRILQDRLAYLRELLDRRQTILKSIQEQNKLTPELEAAILAAEDKTTLEDLYLPYKPKRRTKAQIAKEAGLLPLALTLLENPQQQPEEVATQFINVEKNIHSSADALEGARHILMEQFTENSTLLGELRELLWTHGIVKSEVVKDKEQEGAKFSDYFTYQEPINKIPSHRALALFRGQREEILRIELMLEQAYTDQALEKLCMHSGVSQKNRPADNWLMETINWTWKIKLLFKLELELMTKLRELAEEEAIKVFANNLKNLLMASPAGSRVTLGLDPGLRTGVKVVVIDKTGKLLNHTVIYPHAPKNDWDKSVEMLAALCKMYKVELVSIGNGTASRETDKLVIELKKRYPALGLTSIVVSEAGASVYSASELAAHEFPELDVSYRGAVSIARRLQDPLAELVKIDPKSIGVGQYQHDVNQTRLSHCLQMVMEDCVNAVGVDVNTASAPLLACVAGLNNSIANHIIQYRNEHGEFRNREHLKKVPRLGDKAFEQAAGFLRIMQSDNPLDCSAVHPEAYPVVERILKQQQKTINELIGNTQVLKKVNPASFTDANFGLPTILDILKELEKPGRDPRPEFKTANFKEGIESLSDLKKDMLLEGVVTNVTNFGAFVDIGVHQDGLVHVSMLADRFVKDPHEVVRVGDIVKVKVLEVDIARKRVQLTMRLTDAPIHKQSTPLKKAVEPQNFNSSFGSALRAAIDSKR